MDIIGASLESTNDGTLHYEVINNEGKVIVLEGVGVFMYDLKCRLLRPQDHFMDIQRLKKPEVSFTMIWDNSLLKLSDQVPNHHSL